jgi:Tfp pilus assembly PilM family ATPase
MVVAERHWTMDAQLQCRVTAAGSLRLPADAATDARQLHQTLRQLINDFDLQGRQSCIACLPSELYDYEAVELAAHTATDESERFVYESVQQILGESAQTASYDYWSGSGSTPEMDTLQIVWTAAQAAQQITGKLMHLGLNCKSLDAPALALGRLVSGSDTQNVGLVMDIGNGQVTFVWSRGGVTQYLRNRIRFAETSAAQVLADQLGITEMSAETLLSQWGIDPSSESPVNRTNRQCLEDWSEKLLFEVQRTLRYLQNRFGQASCKQITLCGGGACIGGLSQWLMQHLDSQVHVAGIPSSCQWSASESYSPAYAQALSLVFQGDAR